MAQRGVQLAHLTHAAGLSSTGDALLDARLPVAERYELTEENAQRVRAAKGRGGQVVAVGTSVTRALEAASASGRLRARSEQTELILGPGSMLRCCDGLLTGILVPDFARNPDRRTRRVALADLESGDRRHTPTCAYVALIMRGTEQVRAYASTLEPDEPDEPDALGR